MYSKNSEGMEGFTMKLKNQKPRKPNTIKEQEREKVAKLLDDKSRLERENEQLKKEIKKAARLSAIQNVFEVDENNSKSFDDN